MTTPRKKSGPEVLPSRALEHGEQAFGARFKRPGFALTPELDLAFALGHGSVAFGPVRLLSDLALGKKAKASYTEVHRNVAIAALRAVFFLGGEKALETELRVVERYPGTKQAEALASYSELRSPLAVQLVQRLTGAKSKVKAQAAAWLEAHG